MSAASVRAEREASKAAAATLRSRIAELEHELSRARRCIAELRRSKEARMEEARAYSASSQAAIRILTRLAFPKEEP